MTTGLATATSRWNRFVWLTLGATHPTRDFNYVKDTVRGFCAVATADKALGEVINIGSNFEISMRDTLEMISRLMDADVEFREDEQRLRPEKSEVFRLWGDNTKVNSLTGFEPTYSLEDGLSETIDWFTNPENLKHYKSSQYNL